MRPLSIAAAAAASCVLLAGCTTPPTFLPDNVRTCTPGHCTLFVRVRDCDSPTGIDVDPTQMQVAEFGVETPLVWRLVDSPGYLFGVEGIRFKTAHGGEFDRRELDPGGKVFQWRDRHTQRGEFPYEVNVVRAGPDPRACAPLDPVIKNQ